MFLRATSAIFFEFGVDPRGKATPEIATEFLKIKFGMAKDRGNNA